MTFDDWCESHGFGLQETKDALQPIWDALDGAGLPLDSVAAMMWAAVMAVKHEYDR